MSQAIKIAARALKGVDKGRPIDRTVLSELYNAVELINSSELARVDLAASIIMAERANEESIEGVPSPILKCLLVGGLLYGE